MTSKREVDVIPNGPLVIDGPSCKKASCNMLQEFPTGDDPYCIGHSWAAWQAERDSE